MTITRQPHSAEAAPSDQSLRGVLTLTTDPVLVVAAQLLDGISATVLGALIIADLTGRTGRFNLAQGFVGTFSGVGASLSTTLSGLIAGNFGLTAGFMAITAIALLALLVAWGLLPKTRQQVKITVSPKPSSRFNTARVDGNSRPRTDSRSDRMTSSGARLRTDPRRESVARLRDSRGSRGGDHDHRYIRSQPWAKATAHPRHVDVRRGSG